MTESGLFLGRALDPATGQASADRFLLDADDLTTHGLIVGMTGSGKTALGIVLIEELLRKGVPVLAIDPKGDMGNLLLAFPSLAPSEFAPWVEGGAAGADAEAARWREGLAGWGLSAADVAAVTASREATVYTPGSSAGVPLDLLGSIAPAASGAAADPEETRELVSSWVSGLLGLLGVDADPVRSREHILLSRCVEALLSDGKPATLEAIVGACAQPPFATVGALPVETFFPAKERQGFVLALNNLLASPTTEAFRTGAPLDVDRMLAPAPGGRARLSVVSIAHLGDAERLFVVTTLLSQVRAWVRRQPGSSSLRALLYVDEIFGFFPPSAEPPTKKPLLSLLKQARAFGTGVVLATQNPVDLDYKGLANCGAWWVGTLQTERDRDRLSQGLADASGSGEAAALLSKTKKRVFLLHDVHRKGPALVETRWAMSYLRGPMTREELTRLKALAPPGAAPAAPPAAAPAAEPVPLVPKPWTARWLDRRGAEIATAHLLVRWAVRYRSGKASTGEIPGSGLWQLEAESAAAVLEADPVPFEGETSQEPPARPLRYEPLPAWLGPQGVKEVERALKQRLPDKLAATLYSDPVTGLLSRPGETREAFADRVSVEARPPAALEERIQRKRRELTEAEQAEKGRQLETYASAAGAAFDVLGGLFGKRKSLKVGKVGSVLSKRRMESAAETRVERLRSELAEMEAKVALPDPQRFEEVDVVPAASHVDVLSVGLVWLC
ncbi:MAG: ATP-binding protein [Acidobacteria bacterium]|nr:MAG: ATP-binding protein [Acidobacteriota bacterium]